MPHEIESMMYVGVPPWHGLGTEVPADAKSDDALRLAGLDWKVTTAPVTAELDAGRQPIPRFRAVVRMDDQRPLGVVGNRYAPVQNEAAFKFFDDVVGQGLARYHTAGALDGGRRVWMLAKLPGEIRLAKNDSTEKFVLLTNTHDGSSALRMFLTPVRVVCANTLNIALQRGAAEGISIRHTPSALSRIEEAQRALGLATDYFDRFETEANRLLNAKFTDEQMRQLAAFVMPTFDGGPASPKVTKLRDRVVELFTEGAGHREVEGTAWAALNAVAEFSDHHRGTRANDEAERAENRLKSVWFGTGATMKRRAHEFITHAIAA